MRGNNDWLDVLETRQYLAHSFKGTTWGKHKYVDIRNGKYIYPEDLVAQRRARQNGGSGSVVRERATKRYEANQRASVTRRMMSNRNQVAQRATASQRQATSAYNKPKNLFDSMGQYVGQAGKAVANAGASALNAGKGAAKAAGEGLSKLGTAIGTAADSYAETWQRGADRIGKAVGDITGDNVRNEYLQKDERERSIREGAKRARSDYVKAVNALTEAKSSKDPEAIKRAEAEVKRTRNISMMLDQEWGDANDAVNQAAINYMENPGLFGVRDNVVLTGPEAATYKTPKERDAENFRKNVANAKEAVKEGAKNAVAAAGKALGDAHEAVTGQNAKKDYDEAWKRYEQILEPNKVDQVSIARNNLEKIRRTGDPEKIAKAEQDYRDARMREAMFNMEIGDAQDRVINAREQYDRTGAGMLNNAANAAGSVASGIGRGISETASNIGDSINYAINNPDKVAGAVGEAARGAADTALRGIERAGNAAGNALTAVGTGAKNLFDAAGRRIGGAYDSAKEAANRFAEGANAFQERVDGAIQRGWENAGDALNGYAQTWQQGAQRIGDAAGELAKGNLRNAYVGLTDPARREAELRVPQVTDAAMDTARNIGGALFNGAKNVVGAVQSLPNSRPENTGDLMSQAANSLGIGARADARDTDRERMRQQAIAEGDRRDYNDADYAAQQSRRDLNAAQSARDAAYSQLTKARADLETAGQQLQGAQQALQYAMGTGDRSRIQFAQNALAQVQQNYDNAQRNVARADSDYQSALGRVGGASSTYLTNADRLGDMWWQTQNPNRLTPADMATANANLAGNNYNNTIAGNLERFANGAGIDTSSLYDGLEDWYRSRNGR